MTKSTEANRNDKNQCIGCIVGKLNHNRAGLLRGYIAMLAVRSGYRNLGIGSKLVKLQLEIMKKQGADLCVLETEVSNKGALKLYEKLNFVRDLRLVRYYLNGGDAFRLKLWFTKPKSNFHSMAMD